MSPITKDTRIMSVDFYNGDSYSIKWMLRLENGAYIYIKRSRRACPHITLIGRTVTALKKEEQQSLGVINGR